MKKLLSVLIIFLVSMFCLAGCGSDAGNSSKAEHAIKSTGAAITTKAAITTDTAVTASSDCSIALTDQGITAACSQNSAVQKLDRYKTSSVPDGKPTPVEPQNTDINKKTEYHCTLSITCSTILDNMDQFDQSKMEVLPDDGVIYKTKNIIFYEGESVFDVLLRETRENKIHMEFVKTPIYNSNYIEGINNIYEFDCGELSGWMYKVNDWFPNYGCSRYQLQDGDKVEWVYTCDLGSDVGGDWMVQKNEKDSKSEPEQ